jgi:hypothetical protein
MIKDHVKLYASSTLVKLSILENKYVFVFIRVI